MKKSRFHHITAFVLGLVFAAGIAATLPAQSFARSLQDNDYNTDIRYLYVQPGQTLHNIIRRLYPGEKTRWPRLQADIIRLNLHAFPDGDASRMKAGVRLTLPDRTEGAPLIARKKTQVGVVVATRGRTVAVGADRITRKLSAGKPVFLGDKLVTGENGFMRLRMVDNALLDLRCFSIMVIEKYSLKPKNRTSILNLLQGSLRKVTGEIGKWAEDVYELKTPVASVGVRGTDYALRVFQSKGCDGSADTGDDGLYLKVIKGLVDVYNEADDTPVARGDTLYIPLPGSKPVARTIDRDVIVVEPDVQLPEEESSSLWWWLLGAVALIAVL